MSLDSMSLDSMSLDSMSLDSMSLDSMSNGRPRRPRGGVVRVRAVRPF